MSLTHSTKARAIAVFMAVSGILAGCSESQFGPASTRQVTGDERAAELRYDLLRNPNDTAALKQMGDLQAGSGQWEQALASYREALIVNPDDREARLGLGEAQLALGSFANAQASANAAGGTDVRVLMLRSGALTGMRSYEAALQLLQQAYRIAPRDLDVRTNMAIVSALAKKPNAYALAREAAFAPDADLTHRRNLVLVAGISGASSQARTDAAKFGMDPGEINQILAMGRRARAEGIAAIGVLADV